MSSHSIIFQLNRKTHDLANYSENKKEKIINKAEDEQNENYKSTKSATNE